MRETLRELVCDPQLPWHSPLKHVQLPHSMEIDKQLCQICSALCPVSCPCVPLQVFAEHISIGFCTACMQHDCNLVGGCEMMTACL